MTRLPELDLPYHSLPPTTYLIRTRPACHAMYRLNTPHDDQPLPDLPCLPQLDTPKLALTSSPKPALPAMPELNIRCQALPHNASAYLACHAQTRRSQPIQDCPALRALPYQSLPYQDKSNLDSPSLPGLPRLTTPDQTMPQLTLTRLACREDEITQPLKCETFRICRRAPDAIRRFRWKIRQRSGNL